ncbi:MAG: AraC family transcriptional regulator [Clostridia bacterium]|nr:AraC family transcriptional regulator [Clostridia bacterium]
MQPFYERKNTDIFVHCFENFSFPPHFHDSLELFVVERGSINITEDGKRVSLHEGELCVLFPGRIHSCDTAGTSNVGYIVIIGSSLFGEYAHMLMHFAPCESVYSLESIHRDCLYALRALKGAQEESLQVQRAYTELFLCRFVSETNFAPAEVASDSLPYRLAEYMSEHFCEHITLESVAKALYTSRYHLSRVFTRTFKMHFNDYLNNLRINKAIRLLADSSATVTSVAYDVGFGNVRTFNRAFKKLRGDSPSSFRSRKNGI